jgi:hypothetical protein
MTATLLEMEGTAEEIAERLHGFAERKLHVTVRDAEGEVTEPKDTRPIAEVLAEIAARVAHNAAAGHEAKTMPRKIRDARIDVMGKYAHLPGSVDEFIQRKQEEIDWEDRRYRDARP